MPVTDSNLSHFKTIMPSREIEINLLPIWLGLGLLAALLIYLIYKKRMHLYNSPDTPQDAALRSLKKMHFGHSMNAEMLYHFTIQCKIYLDGQADPTFEAIQHTLEPYKYHPGAVLHDKVLIHRIQAYIEHLS